MGLLSWPCQGLLVLLFPSLIFFVSQDLMHYSALRTLRGVGKIMVLQKGTGSPCRCWIFLSWADFPLQH